MLVAQPATAREGVALPGRRPFSLGPTPGPQLERVECDAKEPLASSLATQTVGDRLSLFTEVIDPPGRRRR
jgi:hypothetical protein